MKNADLERHIFAWRRLPREVALKVAYSVERVLNRPECKGHGGFGPVYLARLASGLLEAAVRRPEPRRKRGECPYCGEPVRKGKGAVVVHDGTGSAGEHGRNKRWHWDCYGEFNTHEFFNHPGRKA